MPPRFLIAFCALAAVLTTALPAASTPPTQILPLPDKELPLNGSAQTLNLGSYFQSNRVANGTVVRMNVRLGTAGSGNIDLELNDVQTPLTVANFIAYINAGRFAHNVVHRSMPDFVIQGGGFYFAENTTLSYVPQFATIPNEPGISNLRGTIAMAKVGSDPNSATSQWFINLSNNNTFLDLPAPISNEFTVFGHVLGNGMAVADAVAALPTYDASSAVPDWTNLPLTASALNTSTFNRNNLVETTTTIIPSSTLGYTAVSNNTSLVNVSTSGNVLSITPVANKTGTAIITVTATDIDALQTNATLNVTVFPAPTFTQNPSNTTVVAGSETSLTVQVTASPVLVFQWQYMAPGSKTWVDLTENETYSGVTSATLVFNTTSSDLSGGQYRCLVSNGFTPVLASTPAKLTVVFAPIIMTHPVNATVKAPAAASFKAAAMASPAATYQWQMSTNDGETFANLTNTKPFSGVTTTTLKITTNATLDGSQFRFVATNSVDSTPSNAALLTVGQAPKITTQPTATLTANAGTAVNLTVVASGNPAPTYQWKKNNKIIVGATDATLSFNSVVPGDAGAYTVAATNGINPAATSKAAKLVVNFAPTITTNPAATVTVKAKATATFKVAATAFPKAMTYHWQISTDGENFSDLTNGGGFTGVTTAALKVKTTTDMSGYKFKCVVTNVVGSSVSSVGTLSVHL